RGRRRLLRRRRSKRPTAPAAEARPARPPATIATSGWTAAPARCELVLANAYSFLLARKPPAPAGCRPVAPRRFVVMPGHISIVCRWRQPPAHRRTARARCAADARATTRPDDKTAAFRRSAAAG